MYQCKLAVAFSDERAAEFAHQGYVVLAAVRMSAKAPQNTAQFLDYPDSQLQQLLGEFMEFKHSNFQERTCSGRGKTGRCEISMPMLGTSSKTHATENLEALGFL